MSPLFKDPLKVGAPYGATLTWKVALPGFLILGTFGSTSGYACVFNARLQFVLLTSKSKICDRVNPIEDYDL